MCTAVTYQTKDHYFGRTLDYDRVYGEEVVVMPRNFPLTFRELGDMAHHYAVIGMAHVAAGVPLYYDGVNERGLAMAGLNFQGNAHYRPPMAGKDNVASFELFSWLLGQCATVAESRERLTRINVTDAAFHPELPPTGLHWMLGDKQETVVIEQTREGLRVYDNPVGVLTNNPPFPWQMLHLTNFMGLSTGDPENHFWDGLDLHPYSRGMGAMGLPGDLSSPSRFVRGAFMARNSRSGGNETESVGQFFHILDSVAQIRGCCRVEEEYEVTQYSSCCNLERGIYYYTTYENRSITGVDMHREDLDGTVLGRYPLLREQKIFRQN